MGTPLQFVRNNWPSLGVELELQLVDAESMALRSAIDQILADLPENLHERVKPEIMQSYLEINTGVCRSVPDVRRDLTEKIQIVDAIAEKHGLRLFWAATHPFSLWRDQQVTPKERYLGLVELLQDTARRLVTFGLHVHVGVDSGDKAIMICDRIMRHLPTLLALSVNSPFWDARNTGLQSQRIKVMEGLPTAGVPPFMRNWSEYVWLLNHMIQTGFIKSLREVWWDVRPHHNFGTVEVRICDMPPDLPTVLSITALIQCLVHALSEEIEGGTYQHDCHPMMVRQNKWRACRYGLEAQLVDTYSFEVLPARQMVRSLVRRLGDVADELGCRAELDFVLELADRPTGAQRQIALYEQTGDLVEVVRRMVDPGALCESAS
ncbi:glutamate--cysteine ligase [soil metagenome]